MKNIPLDNGLLKCIVIFQLAFIIHNYNLNAQEDLGVLQDRGNPWMHFRNAPYSLYNHLADEAFGLLGKRSEKIGMLISQSDWQREQQSIRKRFMDAVGPFPNKTPLNAKITGKIEKEGYRIEKVIFESQPDFFVTSLMFIPEKLKGKAPCVIYVCGHDDEGYRNPVYQNICINLVLKNFIVFIFDPVGQGERLEYFDPDSGKSLVGGATSEHSYPGNQNFITGSSQARYMIWDGIRAVDYVISRKEVDPSRIGITGRSGGGTQSAYIAAFDDRIYAAAPENYVTSFTRIFQSKGPSDAEQNLFNGISKGLDHADYFLVRAPKPALIITTTRDHFSIQGARETAREASRIYKAYGKEENFSMVEDDAAHQSTVKNREAMYAFFQTHLNNPGSPKDEKVELLTAGDMQVTGTGQISTSLGGETVFTLNRKETALLMDKLQISRNDIDNHLKGVLSSARKLSGYRDPQLIEEPAFTGRFQRDGYVVEKYFLKGEGDCIIPYLLMKPEKTNGKALIYLHPSGKLKEASPGGDIEWFVKQGFTVLAPDMPGTGEIGADSSNILRKEWYASILIGRSIVGIRAADVVRLTRMLKRDSRVNEIFAFAREEMSPVLLHAAAFEPAISRIALIKPYCSSRSIVMNRFYNPKFLSNTVPGMLRAYDLPDLAATLAPRKLLIMNPTDGEGKFPKDSRFFDNDHNFIKEGYKSSKAEENLKIILLKPDEKSKDFLMEWIM